MSNFVGCQRYKRDQPNHVCGKEHRVETNKDCHNQQGCSQWLNPAAPKMKIDQKHQQQHGQLAQQPTPVQQGIQRRRLVRCIS